MTLNQWHDLSNIFLGVAVICLLAVSYDVRWPRLWRFAYYLTACASVAIVFLAGQRLIA